MKQQYMCRQLVIRQDAKGTQHHIPQPVLLSQAALLLLPSLSPPPQAISLQDPFNQPLPPAPPPPLLSPAPSGPFHRVTQVHHQQLTSPPASLLTPTSSEVYRHSNSSLPAQSKYQTVLHALHIAFQHFFSLMETDS